MFGWLPKFSRKSYFSGFFYNAFGMGSWEERPLRQLVKEAYKINPTVYACVEKIGTSVAGIPVAAYKKGKGKDGKRTELLSGPAFDILQKPNVDDSWGFFIHGLSNDYNIAGNGYIYLMEGWKAKDEMKPLTKPPAEIWAIQPGSIEAVPNKVGRLGFWRLRTSVYGGAETTRELHPSRIIHRKTYNALDRFFGMSPLEAAARDIDTMNEALRYNSALLRNGGTLGGLIMAKGSFGPDKKKEAQAQVDNTFNNPANSGKWRVIENAEALDVRQLSQTNRDMEFKEGRIANEIGICNVLGVPPEMIGVQGQKTYSNFQEARKAFYEETVLPHMDDWMAELNKGLAPLYGDDIEFDYKKDEIEALQEDRNARATRSRDDYKAGLITANEGRKERGLAPTTDPLGDERMIPLGSVPAEEAALQPELPEMDANGNPIDPAAQTEEDKKKAEDAKKKVKALILLKRSGSEAPLYMHKSAEPFQAFKSFESRRQAWLNPARKAVAVPLKATYERAAANVRRLTGDQGAPPPVHEVQSAVERAIRETMPLWNGAYKIIYIGIGTDFAESVNAGLDEVLSPKNSAPRERKSQRADWEAAIARYLQTTGGQRITQVTKTTREKIMGAVAEGYAAGEGVDAIGDRIDAEAQLDAGRAVTIARTEVVTASNLGSHAAATSFGMPLRKSWLDSGDTRVREDHMSDGIPDVGINEPFTVGGYSLMFPGDSSLGAAAEEVIQCRCTQTYEPA